MFDDGAELIANLAGLLAIQNSVHEIRVHPLRIDREDYGLASFGRSVGDRIRANSESLVEELKRSDSSVCTSL